MSEPRPLHRLFALSWIDFFEGTNVTVEPEKDLSVKSQFIDLVIIRKGRESIPKRLPDGFEDLAAHNLVTFKSHQEALDGWALCELAGHYVNYRKQSSPSMQELLAEDEYRLFAVSARYPRQLAREVPLTPLGKGVYEVRGLTLKIRVIVANQLPKEEQNAMLLMFSARDELLRYGRQHYWPHSRETSSLLYSLFTTYIEDPNMTEQNKKFARDTFDEIMRSVPVEQRLKGLPVEERLKGLPVEERLKGLPVEERLKGLPVEERLQGVSVEERLKGLTPEEVVKALSPEVLALARKVKTARSKRK
jgi:hypothetical protein